MGAWVYVLIAAGMALFLWLWWRSRVRALEIRTLAESCGYHYLGKSLPRSLSLSRGPFNSITSVWNVIDGDPRGKRVVAFDCKFGEGKGSWRRTVIAVKTEMSNITVSSFDPSLRLEQTDDWVFIYRLKDFALVSRQLTPIPELRAYLESV